MSYYSIIAFFSRPTGSGGTYDTDAQSLIDAIELTDVLSATQKDAINYRITQKKIRGTWANTVAYYGFIGSTPDSNKWNWKDPRDLDAAYRLTFPNGATHLNGIDWDGVDQYANTHLNSNVFSMSSMHMMYYSLEDTFGAEREMGVDDGANVSRMLIRYINGNSYFNLNDDGTALVAPLTNTQGCFFASRTSTAGVAVYKNGTLWETTSNISSALVDGEILIGAQAVVGGVSGYSTKGSGAVSIGQGFTAQEALDDYTDEQIFQTMLARQV
jgi:hypothetical protein